MRISEINLDPPPSSFRWPLTNPSEKVMLTLYEKNKNSGGIRILIYKEYLLVWPSTITDHVSMAEHLNITNARRLIFIDNILVIRPVDTEENTLSQEEIDETLKHPLIQSLVTRAKNVVVVK